MASSVTSFRMNWSSLIIGAIGGIITGVAVTRALRRRSLLPISVISYDDCSDPGYLLDLSTMYQNSQVLIVATRLELFAYLRKHPGTSAVTIGRALELQVDAGTNGDGLRHVTDFLDTLVTLRVIDRHADGGYTNTKSSAKFLIAGEPDYIGSYLCNNRYLRWHKLEACLKTGVPIVEKQWYDDLAKDPIKLESWHLQMRSLASSRDEAFATKFNFKNYHHVMDVGGSTATLSIRLCETHPHLKCTTYDMAPIEPVARKFINEAKLQDRITIATGNMFTDVSWPKGADIIVMGFILHNYNTTKKIELCRKAFDALPVGGVLVILEIFADDQRRTGNAGLVSSLNMLITFGGGNAFDFAPCDVTSWATAAGFRRTSYLSLSPRGEGAALAFK